MVENENLCISAVGGCIIKEHNGFLKNVCGKELKCVYSDVYYPTGFKFYVGSFLPCSNDPHFYQACGASKHFRSKIINGNLLCESFICEIERGIAKLITAAVQKFDRFCKKNCLNTDQIKALCKDGKLKVHPDKICDDKCDSVSCEDEAVCNGYTYGMYCNHGNKTRHYVPPLKICDKQQDCDEGEDEANCTVTENTENACEHKSSWLKVNAMIVPVHNFTRCVVLPENYHYRLPGDSVYCSSQDIASYQTNCTDLARVGLRCEINGYMSSVSKYTICSKHDHSFCDDGIDRECFERNHCKVHKHLLCNEEEDCDGKEDETLQICKTMIRKACQRRAGKIGKLPIPTSWIKDGITDCENGADERDDWAMCGKGKTLRYHLDESLKCEEVFICRTGDPGYVELDRLCDGLDTCGNENAVCSVSSRTYSITTSVLTENRGFLKKLSFCIIGLDGLKRQLEDNCTNEQLMFPKKTFGGTSTTLILPSQAQSCDHMYGEQYLYTSCTDRCHHAFCPLKTAPRYEACPNQFPNRVGTIVDNSYLIFLTKSFGNVYTNRYFVCEDNSTCIDYWRVCDLVYDCDDHSDEFYCENHFKCKTSQNLLPKTKHCNGHFDCADLSDECNETCPKTILEGAFLEGLSWFIGILAFAANLTIMGKSLLSLRRCKTSVALINRCLIILIALGDFLIGCYLITISIYDTIIYKKEYCKNQLAWLTSFECSLIGVLSTIGSQISLFSMTGLSIVRIRGIWNSMRIPGEVTGIRILKIATAMITLISASVAIAVVPVFWKFEDFFVNGLKFSDKIKIFIGAADKATVLNVIQSYHGRTKDQTLRWKTLISMVGGMFSNDTMNSSDIRKVERVHFYGNDGVCLFKYFVKNEDPQKLFVWSILALNFICFIFIAVSYLLIGILSHRSLKSLARSESAQQVARRNTRVNRRITIIITTDFLCWVPFIMTCILHSLELIDATSWYSIFSMVILPINSVINPFLYDGTITDAISNCFRSSSARVCRSTSIQTVREWLNPAKSEVVERNDLERPGPSVEATNAKETDC